MDENSMGEQRIEDIEPEEFEELERLLFYEYNEAYEKYMDDVPVYDEVLYYEKMLNLVSTLRREAEETQASRDQNAIDAFKSAKQNHN